VLGAESTASAGVGFGNSGRASPSDAGGLEEAEIAALCMSGLHSAGEEEEAAEIVYVFGGRTEIVYIFRFYVLLHMCASNLKYSVER
jgi:hypothetical protein